MSGLPLSNLFIICLLTQSANKNQANIGFGRLQISQVGMGLEWSKWGEGSRGKMKLLG